MYGKHARSHCEEIIIFHEQKKKCVPKNNLFKLFIDMIFIKHSFQERRQRTKSL